MGEWMIIPFAYVHSIYLWTLFPQHLWEFDFNLQMVYFTMMDVKEKSMILILISCVRLWQVYVFLWCVLHLHLSRLHEMKLPYTSNIIRLYIHQCKWKLYNYMWCIYMFVKHNYSYRLVYEKPMHTCDTNMSSNWIEISHQLEIGEW